MSNSDYPRPIAQFPVCAHCGQLIIQPVSYAPICVQVRNDPPQLIPKSEPAAFLRFGKQVGQAGIVTHHAYTALGNCINVPRVISQLRERLGSESIPCELRPKTSEPGNFGVYYLPAHVRVWEPEEAGNGQ